MKISSFRIVITFVAVSILSLFCIKDLNVNLLPKEQSKSLLVSFSVAGASPEQTEQQATSILENIFSQIKNLKKITSQSSRGNGYIQLFFDANEDMEARSFETVMLIRQVNSQLPAQVGFPTVSQQADADAQLSNQPLLIYTFNGNASSVQTKEAADQLIKQHLNQVKGLKEIKVTGVEGSHLKLSYDQEKLHAYQVKVSDIIETLSRLTQGFYPGSAKDDTFEYFINTKVEGLSIDYLLEQPIFSTRFSNLKIKDLATLTITENEQSTYFRINGKNAVNIYIYAHEGVNAIELAKEVKQEMFNIEQSLPTDYGLALSYDDTEFLQREIDKNLQRTAIALLVLFLFVFLTYRNWKHILNLVLSLCVNLSLSLLVVWIFDVNIHTYTLAGITIAFGLMIDHAIIMIDYYHQYKNRKVYMALLGATFTTIAALLLVFFLPEADKNNLKDFALVIVIALLTSLLTNLFFTVGLYKLLFNSDNAPKRNLFVLRKNWNTQRRYQQMIAFVAKFRIAFVLFMFLIFGIPIFLMPSNTQNSFPMEGNGQPSFFYTQLVPTLEKALGGTFRLFYLYALDGRSVKDLSETKLMVYATLPAGSTLTQMDEIIQGMEQILLQAKGVKQFSTQINSAQFAQIEINFKDAYIKGFYPHTLKSKLTNAAQDWAGVDWFIDGVGQGFSNSISGDRPSYRVKLMGYNYEELERKMEMLKAQLSNNQRVDKLSAEERRSFFDQGNQAFVLKFDQAGANRHLDQPQIILAALNVYTHHSSPFNVNLEQTTFPLIVSSSTANDFTQWDLMNNYFKMNRGNLRLGKYASLELQKVSGVIRKEDRQYIRTLSFDYLGDKMIGDPFVERNVAEFSQNLPIGYSAKVEGSSYGDQKEKHQQYVLLIVMLIVFNYIICSMLFENLKQPLVIIATIPASFIGLFLIFYLFKFPFDQGGFAAFILLGGLVVNAGIFIVNDFNGLARQNKKRNHNKLLIKAISNRSRTIILTTCAAMCGVVPFLLDGPNETFWFSFAIGTIGGLLFSFFAVFILLPVLLYKREKVVGRRETVDGRK